MDTSQVKISIQHMTYVNLNLDRIVVYYITKFHSHTEQRVT